MYINAKKAYHMATYHDIPYTSYKNSMNMYELDCRYIGPASQLSVQTSHQFHQHCQPQIPQPKIPTNPHVDGKFHRRVWGRRGLE